MSTFPLRRLGQTDIHISALGLGTWQFSGDKGLIGGYWEALSPEVTEAVVKAALDGGINWFDTAQAYGGGESERNLARALSKNGVRPEQVHIATKWWPVAKTANNLQATIDDRLSCLGDYPIAHHIVHQPFSLSSVERQMNVMADLLDQGKIQSVGVSNFTAAAICKAHQVLVRRGYGLAAHQYRFSMLHRSIEHNGILDAAKELDITIIAWSPLEQGLLTGRFHEDGFLPASVGKLRRQMLRGNRLEKTRPLIERMRELGRGYNASVSQVALNYLIQVHGDTVVAIPGASKVSQVEQNVGALHFQLTRDEIDGLSRLC